MNERIRELAEQAGISLSQKDFSYYWVESAEDIEKFAELIVRECAEQGDTLAKHYINTHSEQEQVGLLASIADYSNAIKQHFGVEE